MGPYPRSDIQTSPRQLTEMIRRIENALNRLKTSKKFTLGLNARSKADIETTARLQAAAAATPLSQPSFKIKTMLSSRAAANPPLIEHPVKASKVQDTLQVFTGILGGRKYKKRSIKLNKKYKKLKHKKRTSKRITRRK